MHKVGVVGDGVNSSKIKSLVSNEFFSLNFHSDQHIVEFIQNSDVIYITNSKNAFELSDLAIRNGKHLFIENIANFSLHEVETLIKNCKEGNIKSTIHFKENNNPALESIKNSIKNILFIESHRLCKTDNTTNENDIVLDLMLEDIYIVLQINKSEIKRISATGVQVINEKNDIANARLEFSNGCIANFTVSRISLKTMSKMRIFQKDSYYSVDFISQKTDLVSVENKQTFPKELKVETNQFQENTTFQKEMNDFIFCIGSNQNPKISMEDGYKTLDVANKILKKINSFGKE